ncbi:MAG: bifunctional metallophosphatase/5'-nucleotidase [Candidatus Latescibacteria bacterium]|nr:bifunctional metallophosphatase/5'-nucleotidase [Candidatus Latescibacterota bacterium]
MVEVMSRTGYAAASVGSRDFDFGADTLRARAAEARFPFLAANVSEAATGRLLFRPHAIFPVGGVRVGVAGLTPADAAQMTTAERLNGVKVSDPVAAARSAVRALREGGADYVVLLTSMRETDALSLARSTEGADLVVAGDYHWPSEARATMGMAWLMGGTRVVSTPKQGDYVGLVEIAFLREGAGWRPTDVQWHALGVEGAPQDTAVARLVAGRAAAFGRTMERVVGRIEASTGEGVGQVLAGVMRHRGRGEIGVINRGALEAAFQSGLPPGAWTRLDIAQAIRFDGYLVAVTLRGDQVRSLFQRGRGLQGQPGALFFAGVERRGSGVVVNGRPLVDGEDYQVVTSDFLAGGGDGHAEFRSGRRQGDLDAGIRQSLIDYLMANWSASPEDFRGARGTRIWKASWAMTGSFVRNFINEAVDRYRTQGEQAAFLSGVTAVAWSGKMSGAAGYEVGRNVARLEARFDFGQLGRGLRDLAKSSDQIDVAATYRYRTAGVADPLLSAGFLTAFTPQAGAGGRPFQVRGNAGVQRQVGGGSRSDSAAGSSGTFRSRPTTWGRRWGWIIDEG